MTQPEEVKIREVAPRDGFQSWPEFVPTDKKIEIIEKMIEAGIQEIESTSFVNPKAIPQMRDAGEVLAGVPRNGCIHCALVPNLKGAELALKAQADELGVFISASESHNQANVRRSIADSLADLKPIFELAAEKPTPVVGAVAVAFGCPYEGDVDPESVYRIAGAYLDHGARAVILADTTGMATPPRIKALVEGFQERFPGAEFGLHLHNNRGTAMANLYTAFLSGARMFDTALGGIGGCPNVPQAAGNLPTEDVVYLLSDMGVETGIDLMAAIRAARRLQEILGRQLPGQVMKSGPREPSRAAEVCGVDCSLNQ